jgi:hypothetical protein
VIYNEAIVDGATVFSSLVPYNDRRKDREEARIHGYKSISCMGRHKLDPATRRFLVRFDLLRPPRRT